MSDANGENGKREADAVRAADIAPGDIVRLRQEAFEEAEMTPIDLFQLGWPNQFMVLRVFLGEIIVKRDGKRRTEKRVCVMLDPCCGWMVNRATGAPRCLGHPIDEFEKAPPEELAPGTPNKDDRYSGIIGPSGGEVAGLQYIGDPQNPALALKLPFFSRPVVLSGALAKKIAKDIQDAGIL